MAFKTLTQLIQDTITRLRQVPGTGTQVYAEEPIAQLIQEGYDLCVAQRKWQHIYKWSNRELTGTDGTPSNGFDDIAALTDIINVWYGTQQRPLPGMPQQINPFTVTGTVPRFMEWLNESDNTAAPKRFFRVWPLTSVGNVYVYARRTPSGLFEDPEVVVPFDSKVLHTYAAYKYAEADGGNPGAVEGLKNSFADLLKVQTDWYDRQPVLLDPRMQFGPDEWTEWPWNV